MASRSIPDQASPETEPRPTAMRFGHPLPPIPRPLSPMIGRQRELDVAVSLLAGGAVGLVTLTGPGGVG